VGQGRRRKSTRIVETAPGCQFWLTISDTRVTFLTTDAADALQSEAKRALQQSFAKRYKAGHSGMNRSVQ